MRASHAHLSSPVPSFLSLPHASLINPAPSSPWGCTVAWHWVRLRLPIGRGWAGGRDPHPACPHTHPSPHPCIHSHFHPYIPATSSSPLQRHHPCHLGQRTIPPCQTVLQDGASFSTPYSKPTRNPSSMQHYWGVLHEQDPADEPRSCIPAQQHVLQSLPPAGVNYCHD